MQDIPLQVAQEICSYPASFDPELVLWAEKRCSSATEFERVAEAADRENWFPAS